MYLYDGWLVLVMTRSNVVNVLDIMLEYGKCNAGE